MENKLQQAKDEIAQGYGYNDWNKLHYFYTVTIRASIPDKIIDQVAIRYNELCNEWLSVSDILPEKENDYYLCASNYGVFTECLMFRDKSFLDTYNKKNERVRYWRNLPLLPTPPNK